MPADLLDIRTRIDALYGYLDLDAKAREREELEMLSSQPGFWDKAEVAQGLLKKMAMLKGWIDSWQALSLRQKDLVELKELAELEGDESLLASLEKDGELLEKDLYAFELKKMLDGEDDGRDAILSVTPGAGGTEAQDWAMMLMRQYQRWMERRGFTCNVLDLQDGEEAGIKGVTFEVKGEYAYGFLRPEIGVHRLVRISPYDSNARRHTSFASVYAYPVVEDAEIPELKMEDMRVDTYRAQGAGGQHVNKTESAVRMTHLVTGIVVSCQTERSQVQNRENCLKMMRAKLYQFYRDEEAKKRDDKKQKKLKIEWGSQIRSYVLDDRRVKDMRTGVETSDTESVLDGDIDPFINAYLLMEAEKAKEK
jgi:peptide chain release factor 2